MPRAGLSREVVVEQAAVLADETGLDRLTLAAVAVHFGVKQPSLYKHVQGLEGLRRDLAVRGLTEMTSELSVATVGRARGDALHALADAYRSWAVDHPGRYAATLRAPSVDDAEHVAASEAVLRVVFAVLSGYELTGHSAIEATRCLRAALHGFVSLEAAGGFGLPLSVDASYSRLVGMLDQAFSSGTWDA